jgi:hypothetical protein
MNIGEVNKGAIVAIIVLLLGAGGYLWYSQMYTPALDKQKFAVTSEKTAQDGLAAAKAKLTAAQQAIENAKKENGKPDDSVPRVQLARKAVPPAKLIDDAAIVLMDLARRADVRTSFKSESDGADAAVADPAAGGSLNGATPVDLTFKAAGSYQEMMQFMRLVEDTVVAEDGKLYARDRLFNVVKLEIGDDEDSGGSGVSGFSSEGVDSEEDANELVARPGEILFTVTVRMYTSSTDNAQGVGASTVDPAAQPTDTATAGGTDATGAGTGGTGDGSSTGTPAADGSTTTPDAAAGGTPTTDTGAAGAAGGTAP